MWSLRGVKERSAKSYALPVSPPLVFIPRSDDVSQIFPILMIDGFSSVFRTEHDVILAHPFGMRQTVCLVCHTSHLSLCNRPEHPYCTSKGPFCITFFAHSLCGWFFVSLRSAA